MSACILLYKELRMTVRNAFSSYVMLHAWLKVVLYLKHNITLTSSMKLNL